MTDRKSLKINILYSVLQGAYWINFCCVVSYAVVFLQAKGFDNTQLGGVLAAGNVMGFVIGSLLSAAVDRYIRFEARYAALLMLAFQAVSAIVLLRPACPAPLIAVIWALYLACCVAANSLVTKISVDAAHAGISINYSVARGIGSAAYVFASAALGTLTEKTGISVIPSVGLAAILVQAALILLIRTGVPSLLSTGAVSSRASSSTSLAGFIGKYRRFSLLLPGLAALFVSHNIICHFMLNITRNVGGGVSEMGVLTAFSAVMEIPVMFFYPKLRDRFSCNRLLRLSTAGFLIQGAAIAAARSMPGLYAGFALQICAFGLYTPAIVDYVDRTIPFEDSAKAQSLAFGVTTLGSVLSSLIGGYMYDHTSVGSTLWAGCGFAALGMLICLRAVERRGEKGETAL